MRSFRQGVRCSSTPYAAALRICVDFNINCRGRRPRRPVYNELRKSVGWDFKDKNIIENALESSVIVKCICQVKIDPFCNLILTPSKTKKLIFCETIVKVV